MTTSPCATCGRRRGCARAGLPDCARVSVAAMRRALYRTCRECPVRSECAASPRRALCEREWRDEELWALRRTATERARVEREVMGC